MDRIDAPEDHEVRLDHALHIGANTRAVGCQPSLLGGRVADVSLEPGGAEPVEEGVTGFPLHQAQGAAIREGKDGLAAMVAGDRAETIHDFGKRVIPGDPDEPPLAFLPDTTHGVEHAERGINPLGIPMDLVAEKALGERMRGVAVAGGDAAVLDRRQNAARVGAVMGADGLVGRRSHQLSAISIQLETRSMKSRSTRRQPVPKPTADNS